MSSPVLFQSVLVRRCAAILALLAAGVAMFFSGQGAAASPVERPIAGDAVPTGFAEQMGYAPVVRDGRHVNPAGSCSSPVPLPARFTELCRAHDYGYDVLRYNSATGTATPPRLRARLDAALVADMHASCTNPLCHAAAEASRAGLALNTWRQRGRTPEHETGWQVAVSIVERIGEAIAGRP